MPFTMDRCIGKLQMPRAAEDPFSRSDGGLGLVAETG